MKILLYSILIIVFGCQPFKEEKNSKIRIVATTGIIKDAVQEIVKDSAVVESLMGPGVDPHLYKASHGDVNKLTKADIIFYNGLHLEGKMQDILIKIGKIKKVTAVTDGIAKETLTPIEGTQNTYDPHIWFDVIKWKQCIRQISKTIQEQDPARASFYQSNEIKYQQKLDTLHQFILSSIHEIPQDQRILITAHDAFGYFGKAYGIDVRGLQGISTLSEFGLQDVSNLVQFITEKKIKAVFVESSVPQKAIEAVVEGCRSKGHQVKIGGNLYSDSLGETNTPEGTYIGMLNTNVNTIVKALK